MFGNVCLSVCPHLDFNVAVGTSLKLDVVTPGFHLDIDSRDGKILVLRNKGWLSNFFPIIQGMAK